MDSFVWKPAFNTGLAEIDSQHRVLVDLLNECDQTARRRAGGLDPATVARLKAYVVDHFVLEESRMAAAGFENLARHRAQHQYFATRMAELETPASHANPDQLASLVAFLRDWFVHHVLGDDRQYVSCLKNAERT
jgi:hemerythrin-like metal-binding protein